MNQPYPPQPNLQPPMPPERSGGGCGQILACGCMFFIVLTIGVMGFGWMFRHKLMAFVVDKAAHELFADADLRPDEEAEVDIAIDRITDAIRNKQIGETEIERLQTEMRTGVTGRVVLQRIAQAVVNKSDDIAPADKDAFRALNGRMIRGLLEGTLTLAETDQFWHKHLGDEQTLYDKETQTVDSSELKRILPPLKQFLDDHKIPEEPYTYNLGTLANELVDDVLKTKRAGQ